MTRLWRYGIPAATVAFLLLGVAGALRVVGWSNLASGARTDPRPIAFDDYALQFYYGQLGSRFLREGGVTYGYDPSFMAGYPKTPVYYPSSKPYEFSLWLFSRFDPATAFNWTVFAMLAVLPLLMYGAGANFGLPPGEKLAVTAMSAVPHLMVPMAGFYGIMEAAGMVPFIFASFLSVLVVSLVDRFLRTGERLAGASLLVAAPLLYLSHLTAILISGLPIAVVYASRLRALPFRRHLWMWMVALAVALVNWPWIKGYLLFSHYADLGEFYTPGGSAHFVPRGGIFAPFHVYVASPWIVSLVPPLFGAFGLWSWWRDRRSGLLAIFLPQIAFLFVVSFYGAFLGMNAVAPARITLPLALYLILPAAHGVIEAAIRASTWVRRRLPARRARFALASAGGVWLAVAVHGGLPAGVWRPYTLPDLEAREGFTAHGMDLIRWLAEHTDGRGRLLHEETDRQSHQYYGAHMAALIPYYTDLMLAGGPAPYALLEHNFLRFIAGTFQGVPVGRVPDRTLIAYLSLYNVRWVLCWKEATKRRFDRAGFAAKVGDFDEFTLYAVDLPASYFLRGSGRIEVEDGRLRLRDVEPEDGVVAIKFHWLESLRTDPPRAIGQLRMLDDPVPFIAIEDPPRELVIFNDFDYGFRDRAD